jgi:hypothetical protein
MKSRIAMGEIAPSDLAWREGMADWMPVSSIAELKVDVAPPRPETGPYAAHPSPAQQAPMAASSPSPEPYRASQASPAAAPAPYQGGQPPSQGLAVASLVCGILALVSCCIVGFFNLPLVIAAIVTGHLAVSRINANPTAYSGKGMARGGLITGYLGLLGAIVVGVFIMKVGSMDPNKIEKWIEDFTVEHSPPEKQQEIRDQFEKQRKARGE